MSNVEKDELIEAQKQVIGILFEVIKRLQTNNDLDDEYFQLISTNKTESKKNKREKTKHVLHISTGSFNGGT